MTALLLRAADSRALRHAALVALWIAAAAVERLVQMPAGLRFPGLLLLVVVVVAWAAGRNAAVVAIAASLAFATLAQHDVGTAAGDAGWLIVFGVVAVLAASLAVAVHDLRRERDLLRARVAAHDAGDDRRNERERLAETVLQSTREAEQDARSAREALEREARRRDEFLAVLAHELRNPLAPVQHSVQILHRAPGDLERVRRATATIDRQVALMERLIDDLLDVARISQGHVELDLEPRPVAAIVEGALDAMRCVAEKSGHRFDVHHADADACATVDAFRAEQVLVNLLSNAVKYSPRGSLVRIATHAEDARIRIDVRDEGEGIRTEHLGEIFTMFARPGRGARPRVGGMGVGLALARRLAEQQGGAIEAHSAGPGRGATFTVWFPRARA